MMSVTVTMEAAASGTITQPAAATMPSREVSLLIWAIASLPEVWARAGAMVVRRNRFMLRPWTQKRPYRFNRSRQGGGGSNHSLSSDQFPRGRGITTHDG